MRKIRLKKLNDQAVVIVGANSGIGRAAALRFAEYGAQLILSGRSQEALDQLADELRASGAEVTPIAADVTDYAQMKRLADQAYQTYGRIDTWVHAAAVAVYSRFEDTNPEEFKQVIDTNLTGEAYGAMAALPYLKEQGGALILIGSAESRRALPYHSAYAASKHGITGFADALRLELEEENAPVSVTVVMPSSINTPFFSKARTRLGVKPAPVPPVYEPEAAAEIIHFAAEHPVRELFVGGAGKALGITQRLSPRLADNVTLQFGKLQFGDQQKSEHAPNNLFAHIDGYDRVHGTYGDQARRLSLYNRLQIKPWLRFALGTTVLAGVAYGIWRMAASRQDTPFIRELIQKIRKAR